MGTDMPLNTEETIQLLLKTNKEQKETIADIRATIKTLRATIANLNETLDEFKRKLFGTSSENTSGASSDDAQEAAPTEEQVPEEITNVKEHTRARKKKSVRADLYEALPVKEVHCDVREELRITPAKVVRGRYMQETLVCPACREEDETTI